VKDNGSIAGLRITDEFIAALGGLRVDGNIVPVPVMSIEKISLQGGDVLILKVFPSLMPPVRFKGRTWIRVGARKAIATREEEDRLLERRVSSARTFDAMPCQEATIADLDTKTFSTFYLPLAVSKEVLEENGRPLEVKLSALRLFDLRAGHPTAAGTLLFSARPAYFFSGAYLQFLEVDGDTIGAPVKNEFRIECGLYWFPEKLDLLIQTLVGQKPQEVTSVHETTAFSYPAVALRELLLNSIIHRSYDSTAPTRVTKFSDRIEIQSPGGLYGESRAENFPWQTAYRNPIIAEAFRIMGAVNRFGRGVVRAQEALIANGSQEAEFELDRDFVRVRLFRKG
jgi:ATP-dependent DNA helicase RecG